MLKGPNFADANSKDSEKVASLQAGLLSKTSTISRMESQLKSKDQDLVAKQNEMQENEVSLKMSEELLIARDKALKEKEGELDKTKTQLNERDELMLQHEEEWQEKLLNSDMKLKELQAKMEGEKSGEKKKPRGGGKTEEGKIRPRVAKRQATRADGTAKILPGQAGIDAKVEQGN